MSGLTECFRRFRDTVRHGRHRLLPWYTIGRRDDVYLTRIYLTPRTPFGQGLFHIFHRGDGDDDPHDHPWDFWTFPLKDYEEEVLEYVDNRLALIIRHVWRWRWHYRPATHTHRVIGPIDGRGPFCSIVWTTNWKRSWGFWPRIKGGRLFVPWKRYLQRQSDGRLGEPDWNEDRFKYQFKPIVKWRASSESRWRSCHHE